ncbi:hypothetical protein VTN96DRAFT_10274 [Rasamsonia emersonii]
MEDLSGGGEGQSAYATCQSLSNQPVINVHQETAGLTAQGFLDLVEENLATVQEFFRRDRTYIIAQMKITSNPRISNLSLKRSSSLEDKFLCMLHTRETTLQYYARFPHLDITKDPQWWVTMQNSGNRSQGKLKTFAEEQSLPLGALRKGVSVTWKQLIVEVELSAPGIALVFLPVLRRLEHVYVPQLKLLCDLLRCDRYSNILQLSRAYSDMMRNYQCNYNFCIAFLYLNRTNDKNTETPVN